MSALLMDQPTQSDLRLTKTSYPPTEPAAAEVAAPESHQAYITLLFDKYRTALQRYLRRFVSADDAADLVQESYFRLLRRGELVHIEAMARSFLFETATNLARDLRRRRITRHADQHVELDSVEVVDGHVRPDEHLAGEQVRAILERAIAQLPQETRTVFLLHRYRDLSYPQIAALTKLSARTVARKMAQAIEQLSAALGESA
jgi:RNA polymerase sigma factor (sigma-70 family)